MEKRNYSRVVTDFPVEVKIMPLPADVLSVRKGKAVDLSENGVGILLETPLSKSAKLAIDIGLSPQFSLQTEAQAVWSSPIAQERKFYCGLRFLDLREDKLLLLKKVIEDKNKVVTASYFPEQVVTNQEIIEAGLESTSKVIERCLGAVERRAAAPGETAADMMAKVAARILEKAGCAPQDLDYIICSTDAGDAVEPETATAVQAKINASCPAFGVSMSCTGWLATVDIALNYLAAGKKRILLLASSLVGSRVHYRNLMHRAIFGDGAGGMLLQQHNQKCFLARALWTNGEYYSKIFLPYPWSKLPGDIPIEYKDSFYMSDNQEIFFKAMDAYIVPFARDILTRAKITLQDVDVFLLHYPSKPLFEHSLAVLSIPRQKIYNNFRSSGNIATAEMPVLLDEAITAGIIKKGDKVFMLTYGAGFTMGGLVMQY